MVKTISTEYRWSCVKRYIAFESPVSRWEKLIKQMGKHVHKSDLAGVNFRQLPLKARREVFNLVLGNQDMGSNSATTLFNVVLALEDLVRFESATFDLWLNDAVQGCDGLQINYGSSIQWIGELGLRGAHAAWVHQAACLVPDWTCLGHPGPWSGDSRAQFIAYCLDILPDHELKLSAEVVLHAQRLFRLTLGKWRSKLPANFLPHMLVIVEGLTEAFVLPHLLGCLDMNCHDSGVLIIPAGGARQVVRRYSKWADTVSLPILVVLDKDAAVQAEVVSESLRTTDRLHVLFAGEIEDIFDKELFVKLVNEHLHNVGLACPIDMHELETQGRRTEVLNQIWRDRGLGNFDKIGFAKTVANYSLRPEHISQDVRAIVASIKELLGNTIGPPNCQQGQAKAKLSGLLP